MNNNDERKTARTKLKNFIHPIFVKKSYRYLGTPPLMKINRAINTKNLNAVTRAAVDVVFNKNSGNTLKNQEVIIFCK